MKHQLQVVVTLLFFLVSFICQVSSADLDVGILNVPSNFRNRFPIVLKKNHVNITSDALQVQETVTSGNNRIPIPAILKQNSVPEVPVVETKKSDCEEKEREREREKESKRNSVKSVNFNYLPPPPTPSPAPSTTRPYTTGGVYGYTATSAPSPSPTSGPYKPHVSYYRPSTKPPVVVEISTTSAPVFTTTSSTMRPTMRPVVVITNPPIFTTTPTPTTTTLRPPIFQTTTSSSGSTIVPIIGVEGDDDDDDDLRDTTQSTFNTEGVSVGRSLFSGLNRLNTPRTTTPAGTSRRLSVGSLNLNSRLHGSRGLKFGADPNVVTEFVFSDIKCYRTKNKEYFGASIHMKSGFHLPYIRDRPQDPLTSSDCRMEPLDTPSAYHITVMDLRGCGVEQCGDSLCLTMVFPRVPTLALADDEVTTIKCQPQKSSISETRTISFAGDNLENRRSSSTVEGGTQEFAAEVGVFRQNPGANNGLFVKRVNSGGVVQLGEPLQLRSVVRGGDGWAHSKLTDVKVWRMRDNYAVNLEKLNPSDASEVITLVDANGCRNSEYEVIAESHPLRDPRNNLVHHFTFKAFLFRGQRANEPLIVTAKVMACQEAGECKLTECIGSRSSDPNISRYKRSPFPDPIEHHNASSIVHDFRSQLALRVVGLQDHSTPITKDDLDRSEPTSMYPSSFSCAEKMGFSAAGGGIISIFVCGLALSLIFYTFKYKNSEENSTTINLESNPPSSKSQNGNFQKTQQTPRKTKPLPPPPKDYADINDNNNVTYHGSHGSRLTSDVAKIIHQLSTPDTKRERETEYECIDEVRGQNGSKEDGVYIVYCYPDKKKTRPTSAPPSLRDKKRAIMRNGDDPSEEDSEESYSTAENIARPKTVRSVKRNNHQKPRGGTGIRRRLSSIYREVYENRCRSGSFPARITAKNTAGGRRNKIGNRQEDRRENSDIYSDGFSRFSSDLDSAYCGSNCDGSRSTEEKKWSKGSKGRTFCREASARRSRVKIGVIPSKENVRVKSNENLLKVDHNPHHFDSSIIIYPETDV